MYQAGGSNSSPQRCVSIAKGIFIRGRPRSPAECTPTGGASVEFSIALATFRAADRRGPVSIREPGVQVEVCPTVVADEGMHPDTFVVTNSDTHAHGEGLDK